MKFYKKKIFINLTLFIVIILIAEFCSLLSYRIRFEDTIKSQSNISDNPKEFFKENIPHYIFPRKFDYKVIEDIVKPRVYPSNKKTSKRPIITIGCSYTEGVGLEENQTFAYKLNKYTGRTTYNCGIGGSGLELVYRQLSDDNFKNNIPDAEYVIYTFLYNHLSRQFQNLLCPYKSELYINYSLKNGHLKEDTSPFWFMYWSFLVKAILEYQENCQEKNERINEYPLFYATLQATVDEMHKKYPNSKFVFIEFPEAQLCIPDFREEYAKLTSEQIKRIEEMGIIYINASELAGHKFCGKKYRVADNDHPSETTWDELIPLIAKKLKL